MRLQNIVRRGGLAATLLLGVGVLSWVTGSLTVPAVADESGSTTNVLALHDRSSRQYNRNCTNCHAAVLTERSLDPARHTAHVAMQSLVPGENANTRCAFCHRSVTWLRQGTGSLRKHVDNRLCALCHGDEGPARKYYQTSLSLTRLNGAGYYGLFCEGCHGPLARSEVRGESAREIRKKIVENEGGMGPLNVLTNDEIQAIAGALATAGGGD